MPPKKLTHRPSHGGPLPAAYRSPDRDECPAKATGSIRDELGFMGDSIDRLAKSVSILKERLQPVSQSREPCKGECGGPQSTLCEVGEDIRSKAGNIDSLRQQVESMTAELDI